MNILWIAPYPHPSQRMHPAPWVTELCRKLVNEKVSITILTTNSNISKMQETISDNDYTIVFLKTPKCRNDFLTLYRTRIKILGKYLRNNEDRYDLLHIHGTEHQYEASACGSRLPMIISIQGIISECVKYVSLSDYKNKLLWLLSAYYEKKYFPKNHYYFCRTKWDKKIVMGYNPDAKIFHNWEPIREEFFKFQHNTVVNSNCVLFLGGSDEIKGYKIFIRTLDIVRAKHDITAIIAGNTDILKIRKFILTNRFRHVGIVNLTILGFCSSTKLIEAIRKSFCLVHPSLIDNSPNSVCEAQIVGLPVIASDVGGVGSLIENGRTGILTDLNPANIADSILELYENPALRKDISLAATNMACTRHNYKTIVQKTLRAYNELIEEHNNLIV